MGKKKEKEDLDDCMMELYSLEQYIRGCMVGGLDTDGDMDSDILLLLVKTMKAKLEYYQQKYHFQIDKEDMFFVDGMDEFYHKAFTGESLEDAQERGLKEMIQKSKEYQAKKKEAGKET